MSSVWDDDLAKPRRPVEVRQVRVFVSAPYADRLRAGLLASLLVAKAGAESMTEWWNGPADDGDCRLSEIADLRVAEVKACDVLVHLPAGRPERGGNLTEFGMAVALRKRVVAVGHRPTFLHHHSSVLFVPDEANAARVVWEWSRRGLDYQPAESR